MPLLSTLRRGLLAVWALTTMSVASAGTGVRVVDDTGAVLMLNKPPQRVVSMLPSLTEVVCDLGHCQHLVGVDRWANWPASVRSLPRLGGLEDPNVEGIVALKPDVVLVSSASRLATRLRQLGVNVVQLDTTDLPGVQRVMRKVAALWGDTAVADARWRELQAQLAQAARMVPAGWQGARAYVEVSRTPFAAGQASYVGQVLQHMGLGNVVPASLGAFPQISPEFVIKARPDWVVVSKGDLPHLQSRPGWAGLSALQGRRWCALGPEQMDLLARPGPRLGQAALMLAQCVTALPPPATSVARETP